MRRALRILPLALGLSCGGAALGQTQAADPDFRPEVARPAYRGEGPVVAIDRAHHNFHTADGRFAPFARLLRADGYRVIDQAAPFSAEGLAGIGVLVIANALGPDEGEARAPERSRPLTRRGVLRIGVVANRES